MRLFADILLIAVLAFSFWQLAFGGGEKEHGREGTGPVGGLPYW